MLPRDAKLTLTATGQVANAAKSGKPAVLGILAKSVKLQQSGKLTKTGQAIQAGWWTMHILAAWGLAVVAAGLLPPLAVAQTQTPPDKEIAAARQRVEAFLKTFPDTPPPQQLEVLSGDGLGAVLPRHVVFGVVYRHYPVGVVPPAPLRPACLLAVPKAKDQKIEVIPDQGAWEKFLAAAAVPPTDPSAAAAYLRLFLHGAATLRQDGFFRFTFEVDKPVVRDNTITVRGAAKVEPKGGDKGEIRAQFTFRDGRVVESQVQSQVISGVRPICQATKLLDPDPIVRRMAEDAIRVMGRAARPYLEEQRAKAPPELRQAIDRLWERIEREDIERENR